MAIFRPFRARRYATDVAGPLGNLLAPPYDVIGSAQREQLLARSPHSIVRIDLSGLPEDPADQVRYDHAAALFAEWVAGGVLPADHEPSYYVYEQEFHLSDGARRVRRGLTGLLHLEDFETGVVVPHEHTWSGPKADRLKLLEATKSSFSDILTLYSDPSHGLDALLDQACHGPPTAQTVWGDDQVHRLWRIAGEADTHAITAALAPHRLMIADGHHRYETALRYRDLQRQRTGGAEGPWEWANVFVANSDSPGVVILPTHRLLTRPLPDLDQLPARAAEFFHVEEVSLPSHQAGAAALRALGPRPGESHVLGFYREAGRLHRLCLRASAPLGDLIPGSHSPRWRALDVSLLHEIILPRLLRLPAASLAETVTYTAQTDEAIQAVRDGAAGLFLMNPPEPAEVLAVALGGERLPHKATYFYPKLLTGLVVRDLRLD